MPDRVGASRSWPAPQRGQAGRRCVWSRYRWPAAGPCGRARRPPRAGRRCRARARSACTAARCRVDAGPGVPAPAATARPRPGRPASPAPDLANDAGRPARTAGRPSRSTRSRASAGAAVRRAAMALPARLLLARGRPGHGQRRLAAGPGRGAVRRRWSLARAAARRRPAHRGPPAPRPARPPRRPRHPAEPSAPARRPRGPGRTAARPGRGGCGRAPGRRPARRPRSAGRPARPGPTAARCAPASRPAARPAPPPARRRPRRPARRRARGPAPAAVATAVRPVAVHGRRGRERASQPVGRWLAGPIRPVEPELGGRAVVEIGQQRRGTADPARSGRSPSGRAGSSGWPSRRPGYPGSGPAPASSRAASVCDQPRARRAARSPEGSSRSVMRPDCRCGRLLSTPLSQQAVNSGRIACGRADRGRSARWI